MSYQPILDFWLGELDSRGQADEAHARRWFSRDQALDRQIAARFGATYDDLRARRREDWRQDPRGRLAYVIALDQFARNMFRGTARAFEGDEQAVSAAAEGVDLGQDGGLLLDERWFLYMPFMHSETLALQERALALFTALAADAPAASRPRYTSGVTYAEQHRAIVMRFGRFPHRNAVVGRASTPEELEFLKQPGSAF
jgi:uncharacterized protein (DUF924 family)